MTFTPTRRSFLATTSLACARTLADTHGLIAQQLPVQIIDSSQTANALLPEPMASIDLHRLATYAVDAARSAGASYADIRLAELHHLYLGMMPGMLEPGTTLMSTFTYGLRVIVDGTWAFMHGTQPSLDGVILAARNAVITARGYAPFTVRHVEMASAPVVVDEWTAPMQVDPFTVPLQDQAALIGAYQQAGARVRYGWSDIELHWTRETRVFASTDGALVTQRFHRSDASVYGYGDCEMGRVRLSVPRINAATGGYETVAIPGIEDDITRTTENAVQLAALPTRTLEVGRYPVMFDGITLGAVFGRTIGHALELDRVLGYEADASGTSYLSPPEEVWGSTVASSLLTATGSHAAPTLGAIKWDDEGVEAREYPIITRGRLVNYHTSRQTAAAIRALYEKQRLPFRSNGCAIAPEAEHPVLVRTPHLTVTAAAQRSGMEDLCKGIVHGVLVRETGYLSTDQQLASGSLLYATVMLEIEQGKIVRRLMGNGLQFGTTPFWKSLMAIGDATTVCNSTFGLYKGQPWRSVRQSATAPAGLFKDVHIISTKSRV